MQLFSSKTPQDVFFIENATSTQIISTMKSMLELEIKPSEHKNTDKPVVVPIKVTSNQLSFFSLKDLFVDAIALTGDHPSKKLDY